MKITTSKYLNARTAPSTKSDNPSYTQLNQLINIVDVVVGDPFEGSAIWFRADDNLCYWSGGFVESAFSLETVDINNFSIPHQQIILEEACRVQKKNVSNTISNFVDLKVKATTKEDNVVVSLEILVTKENQALPTSIQFKGIEIPISVTVGQRSANQREGDFSTLNTSEKTRILNEAKDAEAVNWLKQFSGVQSVKVDFKVNDGIAAPILCLVFQVNVKVPQPEKKIPSELTYTSADGRVFKLPTDVEGVGETVTHAVCAADDIKHPGCSVGRRGTIETGTIGLKVFRESNGQKQFFVLSCYHVLCAPELESRIRIFQFSKFHDFTIVSPGQLDGNGKPIGHVVDGVIDEHIDAAIALLDNPVDISESIVDIDGAPLDVYVVSEDDVKRKMSVRLSGRTSGVRKGIVKNAKTPVSITYPGIGSHQINHVIMASRFAEKGDSGACVVSAFGETIGLLVASNADYSYIIPIDLIINPDNLNVKLCFHQD